MTNIKRWALAFGIATAGLIGGATGVTATIAEGATLGQGQEIASHEDSENPGDQAGQDEKGDKGTKDDDRMGDGGGAGGDSSDKADDDGSDAGDTDGPGDDEDD